MNRKGIRIIALLTAALLMLTGCGDTLYELTTEENELVVQYSAYYVSKYNTKQTDGMNSAQLTSESESTKTESEEEMESETESETESESGTTSTTVITGKTSVEDLSPVGEKSIAEILGLEGSLDVTYEGYTVGDYYMVSAGFSLDASSSSKKMVVLKFKLTNTGDTTASIDMSNVDATFYANLTGTGYVKERSSYLSLSSLTEDLAAGESSEEILIFEISSADIDMVTDPILAVTIGNTTSSVKL